jgi:hypothetical protein
MVIDFPAIPDEYVGHRASRIAPLADGATGSVAVQNVQAGFSHC